MSSSVAGAEIITFFAPAVMCLFASAAFSFFTAGSGFFFLGFSNCFKSIVLPVIFGPDNFLYCVSIV